MEENAIGTILLASFLFTGEERHDDILLHENVKDVKMYHIAACPDFCISRGAQSGSLQSDKKIEF